MTLLLDTHAWVWAALEPRRLSARARAAVADPAHVLLVSPISCWEVAVLREKGRLDLPGTAEAWVADALAAPGVEAAPLTCEIALAAATLPPPFHGDPADRFLVATARRLAIPLVTADARIRRYRGVRTLW